MAQSKPILIVDDDPNVRALISNVLGEDGFAIFEAACGEEALHMAREHMPRVVLLDVKMPGLSGYEVCRKLKDDFGDGMSVIFISGERREPFDRVAGLLLGGGDYPSKPFALEGLLARGPRLGRPPAQKGPPGIRPPPPGGGVAGKLVPGVANRA